MKKKKKKKIFLKKKKIQNGRLKKVHFSKSPIPKFFLWKFHGLVIGLLGLIDKKQYSHIGWALHINQSHSNIWLTLLVLRSLKRFTHNRLDEVFFKYARMQSVYLQKMKDMQMQLHFRFYVWRIITWKCNVHRNTNLKDEWTGLNLNSIWIFAIFPAASKMHSFVKIGFAILFSPQQC